MRENLGLKGFQQALIPNGLKIICKVLREIYTPEGYRGEGVPERYKPGGCPTYWTGGFRRQGSEINQIPRSADYFDCAPREDNLLQRAENWFDFAAPEARLG
jgi:hypothetical protein